MRITETTPATIRGLWVGCDAEIKGVAYVEDVAEAIVGKLYDQLVPSLVLLRLFLTVPFVWLPERERAFALQLARSVHRESELGPHTPVHALLATRGCVEPWNDRRKSLGHVAIPLLSEEFVSSIPMMSRLLKELGLPLTWVFDPGAVMERQSFGSEVGYFHVADAAVATDEMGRRIIPAHDFVAEHGVRSVFAVGGGMFGGSILVLIFFSREPVETRTVRTFMPLVNLLKGRIISTWSMMRIFRPCEDRPAGTTPGIPGAGSR